MTTAPNGYELAEALATATRAQTHAITQTIGIAAKDLQSRSPNGLDLLAPWVRRAIGDILGLSNRRFAWESQCTI